MDIQMDREVIKFKIKFYEEILRIIVKNNYPFQLKGGFLNCLSYPDPLERLNLTEDIDFVYLLPVDDPMGDDNNFRKVFANYIQTIQRELIEQHWKFGKSEVTIYLEKEEYLDGYLVDYEMEEDFLSVGFTIACLYDKDLCIDFDLGITMNLPLYDKPTPITYHPVMGEPFVVPYTASPEVQIGWKLHQCLVRIRAKDLVDLCYMIPSVDFSKEENIYKMLRTVVAECMLGDAEQLISKLKKLLTGNYDNLWKQLQEERYIMSQFRSEVKRFISFIDNKNGDMNQNLLLQFQSCIVKNIDADKCCTMIDDILNQNRPVPIKPLVL